MTSDEGIERVELTRPREALLRSGATVLLTTPRPGRVLLFDHLDHAGTERSDATIRDVDLSDVAGIVVPGGVANADLLRTDDGAVRLLADALESGLPVATVCHAPWVLIETGLVGGRTLTSWPSLRTDLANAGATWVDREVVLCDAGPGPLVTSRGPDDLEAFASATVEAFARTGVR